jgi:tetratricopeptide (TPR) repeat protein
LNLDQYPLAVADLQKALKMNPNHADSCNELAWVYVTGPPEIRAPDRALALAQKATRMAPSNWIYRNTRGVVYYRLGQFDAAIDDLQRSIQDNKEGATADDLFFLAMAYHGLGNAAKAREYYDQAIRWCKQHTNLSPREKAEQSRFRAEAQTLLKVSP